MSVISFNLLPPWAMAVSAGAHLAMGFVVGRLYFRGLWWNAQQLAKRDCLRTAIAVLVGRVAVLGGVLTLTSLEGAIPLLVTALGLLIARQFVMTNIRNAAP